MNQFTQGIHQGLCGTLISLPSSFLPSLPSAFLPAFLCCPPLSFHKQFLEQIMHWIQFYALGFCQTTWLGFFTHGVQTQGMESLYFCFPFEWYFCWIKNSKNSRFFVILLFLFFFFLLTLFKYFTLLSFYLHGLCQEVHCNPYSWFSIV